MTANRINPDIAIVFEGSPADDSHRNDAISQGALRKGPQIRHRDQSMIVNPRYIRWARKIAKEHAISFQDAVRAGGGTNAGKIHLNDKGVPTLVLGVPVRYAHTHYGISTFEDYLETLTWSLEIIKALDDDVINRF